MIKKNNILWCFLAILGASLSANAQTYQELSKMKISLGEQTYSAPIANKSVVGEPIAIAGISYTNGVGVHAYSSIKIKTNKTRNFTAKVGVNDANINYTTKTVKSIPLTDGKRIFYNVTKTSKQFLGVEGENGKVDKGSVIFKVLHKGKEVFNSGNYASR